LGLHGKIKLQEKIMCVKSELDDTSCC
jgi:hypothetical protein